MVKEIKPRVQVWCKIEQLHTHTKIFLIWKKGMENVKWDPSCLRGWYTGKWSRGSKGGGWVMEGKVECSVPHWGRAHSVAAETCQITESTVEDTWIFTPEHSGWLLQMSKHVLRVWKDGGGLCHAITHRVWKVSSCALRELPRHAAQFLDSWVYFPLYCC